MVEPTEGDWQILKRCLRYLKGTLNLGITYCGQHDSQYDLTAYSDADYAGDPHTYRSTTGYLIFRAGAPIAWKSKLQKSAATSTTEAEFVAVTAAAKKVASLREFGRQLQVVSSEPTPLYCDNRGAVLITANELSAQRTIHLGAQLGCARDYQKKGTIDV